MTTRLGKHLFSFSDFNPARRLSTTMGEPAIAGHIRWLKRRAQLLLPTDAGPEFHRICHEWSIEAFHDECVMQREAKWSPHARFDLKKKKDEDFPDFPSDTEPVVLGAWLTHVLESGKPNPQRKLRPRRKDGSRPRTHVRLHEMLAAFALSELHRATVLLVEDPKEHAAEVAALLMSASELMNRSELHRWAGSRLATAGKSAPRPVSGKVAVAESIKPSVPLKPYQARVTRHAGNLDFEFRGERCRVLRVTQKGSLTRGFSMLLDLFLVPGREVELMTLDKSFSHKQHAVCDAYREIREPEKAAKRDGLYVGSAVEVELETDHERSLMRLLEDARAAELAGDMERAQALRDNALRMADDRQSAPSSGTAALAARPGVTGGARLNQRYRDKLKRDSIRNCGKCLNGAITRIETEFPALGKHLQDAIPNPFSVHVSYNPRPSVEWIVEDTE